VEVSKFYVDHRPLSHTLQPQLPTQQYFELPLDSESIEIGDTIEVFVGEQTGKRGIVQWFPKGGTHVWFQVSGTRSSICVPAECVKRTHLVKTLQCTKERGYDIRPGDVVSVLRGPEYQRKGVVKSVDFPNGRLTLISDMDFSLVGIIHFDSNISDL
jgi:transcription elongation factor